METHIDNYISKAEYDNLKAINEEYRNFLSLLIGSMSLERIERFDLLEKAKELFHRTTQQ